MGSISTSVRGVAAGGGLIALALVAGCGSSGEARASNEAPSAAPVEAATIASGHVTTNAAVVGTAARPAPSVATAGGVASDTLCQTGETSFFSCEIGAKRVSVCRGGSGAVYRYGTAAKVELTSRRVSFANRGFSGGGESQITATNDDYTYTVYDRTVRTSFGEGGNDPEFSSGLVIARGGKVISSKVCKGESPVESAAEQALPAGSFVEH